MNNKILKTNKSLFWDVDLRNLDIEKHEDFIIARVLEYGNIDDLKWLFQTYSRSKIQKVLTNTRAISPKSAYFWKYKLNVKEPLRCLQKHYLQTRRKHWNN